MERLEKQELLDDIIVTQSVDIKSLILTIRGVQVLLDSDVALLYGYETKYINRAASRNKARFPNDFRFQLTEEEFNNIQDLQRHFSTASISDFLNFQNNNSSRADVETQGLRCQNGTLTRGQHRKYCPHVYTEQGIAMLSGLLKNDIAVQVSIGIMQAFVELRRVISYYGHTFERLTNVEYKLLEHDKRFDDLFDHIQTTHEFNQGLFYKGQIYDAFKLIVDIIRSADTSIIIIDNYVDDSILEMLADKKMGFR